MRAVVQRVLEARVRRDGQVRAEIGRGLLTMLGFEKGDEASSVHRLMAKIVSMLHPRVLGVKFR